MAEMTLERALATAHEAYHSGRLDEAAAIYRQIVGQVPSQSEALNFLGIIAFKERRLEEALDFARRAVSANRAVDSYHVNLGVALLAAGRVDEAVAALEEAIVLGPRNAVANHNYASALLTAGRVQEAVAAGKQAVKLNPRRAETYINLAAALRKIGRADEAEEYCRRALDIEPNSAEALNNLGGALSDQGRRVEALAAYRRAVEIRPTDAAMHSALIYAMHFLADVTPALLKPEHEKWDRMHAQPLRASIARHENERLPDRKLRIGYLSPDFYGHVIGWNLLPLLSNHDRERFEIFCYSAGRQRDEMTRRLMGLADCWRDIANLDDELAARMIREDRIDVLVDLTLHMPGNRLMVFARKPAPIQVTYLGYCGTTGLSTMDYRLSDSFLDEPNDRHGDYVEETIRLRSYWCYEGPGTAGEVGELPASRGDGVTFGCLNSFAKVSDAALSLWGRLMMEVAGSRLLMLAPAGSARERVKERLAAAGIGGSRIEFVEQQSWGSYMRTYGRIDIGLDTLPYGGGITACDALWMGVPVVTLIGGLAIGRGAFSILSNIGLDELAGRTEEEFVSIATGLAKDLPRLAQIRAGLRARMETSPLRDAKRFARDVESAYREMWRKWCGNSR